MKNFSKPGRSIWAAALIRSRWPFACASVPCGSCRNSLEYTSRSALN
ncbi:hypothetical protein DVG79_06840 [Exiguobacterium sp. RIT594]|nr:hypothetical protein DVG79_06840 [Exiguobacterium sp. RIT594]